MYTVYVLYSCILDKYYIGQTMDIDIRINEHNQGVYKNSFTKRASDWQLFFSIPCDSRSVAIKIEAHIKKMRSRRYLESLKKYPEISEKLVDKYSEKEL